MSKLEYPSEPELILAAVDEHDDRDYWHPLECENPNEYRATRFYNTTTFKYLSRLCELVNPVLATISGRGRSRVIDGQIESVQNRLEFWYDQLPSVLRIDEPRQRPASPPPHILSMNLLYRTLLLILFRHYQREHVTSTLQAHKLHYLGEQAAILHDLFILYCRTFQCKAHTYLISYCVYTAATVDIGFIRIGTEEQRHGAALRLRAAIKILEAEGRQTPGIKKSVDTIKKQIKSAATEREQAASGMQQAISQQPSFDQAFATSDPSYRHDSIGSSSSTSMQEFVAYSQGGPAQYVPDYSTFQGQQHAMMPSDAAGWQTGGQHHNLGGAYNPAAFSWNYGQSTDQGYGAAQMYGWPPTSR